MTEAEIQREILDYLKRRRYTVLRTNAGGIKISSTRFVHLAPKGTPDLLAIDLRGEHHWIEVKTPNGAIKEEQKEWIDEHRSRGCDVIVARSVDDVILAGL